MQGKRLDGWKGIAGYLGKETRTVQRWEKEQGLPVHRVGGGKRSGVFAFDEEIDQWLVRGGAGGEDGSASASPRHKKRSYWRLAAYLFAALFAVALTLLIVSSLKDNNPAYVELEPAGRLLAFNASGQKLWERFFEGGPLYHDPVYPAIWVGDLDDDWQNEVLFVFTRKFQNRHAPDRLFCLDHDGAILWEYRPGYEVAWDGETFSGVYSVRGGLSIGSLSDDEKFIALAANNKPSFPSQVSILNNDGQLLGEYWNTGYVFDHEVIDLDQDGVHEILLAGINNYHEAPFFAVISPDLQKAISPVAASYAPEFATGLERAYCLLPRTDVAEALHADSRIYRVERLGPASFLLEVEIEDAGEIPERTYRFDATLNPLSLEFPTDFQAFHNKLEREDLLDHPFDEEIERSRLLYPECLVQGDVQSN